MKYLKPICFGVSLIATVATANIADKVTQIYNGMKARLPNATITNTINTPTVKYIGATPVQMKECVRVLHNTGDNMIVNEAFADPSPSAQESTAAATGNKVVYFPVDTTQNLDAQMNAFYTAITGRVAVGKEMNQATWGAIKKMYGDNQ